MVTGPDGGAHRVRDGLVCFHCVTDYNPSPDTYWRQVAWAANGVSLNPTYRMSSVEAAS